MYHVGDLGAHPEAERVIQDLERREVLQRLSGNRYRISVGLFSRRWLQTDGRERGGARRPSGPDQQPLRRVRTPIAGPEFVGRTTAFSSIRNRTFTSLETASVWIVGPPRVGKSSLARHVHDQLATGSRSGA